jgi:hypothetical protein
MMSSSSGQIRINVFASCQSRNIETIRRDPLVLAKHVAVVKKSLMNYVSFAFVSTSKYCSNRRSTMRAMSNILSRQMGTSAQPKDGGDNPVRQRGFWIEHSVSLPATATPMFVTDGLLVLRHTVHSAGLEMPWKDYCTCVEHRCASTATASECRARTH